MSTSKPLMTPEFKAKLIDMAQRLDNKVRSDEDRLSQIEIPLKALERQFAQSKK